MNDAVIIAVANAITAQAETLKALIDALPKETKLAVENRIGKVTPPTSVEASTKTTPKEVVVPVVQPVAEVVVPPVVVSTTPMMPTAPFPAGAVQQPVQQPVQQVAAPQTPVSNVPFTDNKGMLKYVMDSYQSMGAEKGQQIQSVLTGLGVHNINDVKPEQYENLFAGVEKLKNS